MSSIREVAKVSGLSIATISRALRSPEKVAEQTRARVLEAVNQVGYRPNMLARNFRWERSFTVLVLVPGISNPFFAKVIAGIEEAAQRRGYAVILGDTRDSPEREAHYVKLIDSRLADGVLQLSPDYRQNGLWGDSTPPVVHACGCELTPAPSVRIDNVGATRQLVEHLTARGHRRIAAIGGAADNPHTIDRLRGYAEGLEAAGLPYDPDLVLYGDFSMASGAEAARALIDRSPRPTAIMCMNDEMAIGARQALYLNDIATPGDIALTGFDNIGFAEHCTPALTTIDQPAEDMGAAACEMLIDWIEGRQEDRSVHVLPHRLVVRESTG